MFSVFSTLLMPRILEVEYSGFFSLPELLVC
jgi:hypothetical protein